jgi:hypothetical protein
LCSASLASLNIHPILARITARKAVFLSTSVRRDIPQFPIFVLKNRVACFSRVAKLQADDQQQLANERPDLRRYNNAKPVQSPLAV